MKQFLFILISLFFINPLLSQTNRHYETNPDRKRNINWLFGNNVWIDFNNDTPAFKTGCKIGGSEPAASISDTSGKLLFYTNGQTIWNQNHDTFTNGNGLLGDWSSSQGTCIVPLPENDSLYYVFTTDDIAGPNGFRFNLVKYKNGSGIVLKKNILLQKGICESISVTIHADGKSTWVVVHSSPGNTFYAYLITKDGLLPCPKLSKAGHSYDNNFQNAQTYAKFSLNSKYFAISAPTEDIFQVLEFNNLEGYFKSLIVKSNFFLVLGLEFSPNNRYLYILQRDRNISQYDLTFNTIRVIKSYSNSPPYKGSLLLSNNKIYVGYFDSFYLASLNNIDSSSVGFQQRALDLKSNKFRYGLPNFNMSYSYTPSVDFLYNYNCFNNSVALEGRDTFDADSFNWRTKRIYNSGIQFSNIKSPTINFPDTGLYEIRYIAAKGSRSDTVIKYITIYPKINIQFLGRDTMYKSDVPFSLDLKAPKDLHCIRWQDSSSGETFTADTAGTYYVKVTNKAFCSISDTIRITHCLNSLSKPVIFRSNDTLRTQLLEADTFIWYRNNQLISITKDTFIILADTGTYRVEAAKQGYCNSSSNPLVYKCFEGLAQPGIFLNGDTLYANQPQADSFLWFRNNVPFRKTSDSFIVLSDTGIFRVEAIKQKYCNQSSASISNKCLNNLIKPSIFLSRDTLFTNQPQADSFVWFRNGQQFNVTKQPFIKLSDTGIYRVEAAKKQHCNRSSSSWHVSKLDVSIQQLQNSGIEIYPNPADEAIIIDTESSETFMIRIFDYGGKLVFEKQTGTNKTKIDISYLTQGLYIIELSNYKTLFHYKIIIQ